MTTAATRGLWSTAQLRYVADVAARMWTTYTGGWITSEIVAEPRSVRLIVRRAASATKAPYPSLVDASLAWLILESAVPGAILATTEWQSNRAVNLHESLGIRPIERMAQMIAFEATRPTVPLVGHVDIGRGAWEQAGYLAASASPCRACPFREGSNLDCEVCRPSVLERKAPDATWSPEQVTRGIAALDFDAELALGATQAAGLALAAVAWPFLSGPFFREWAARFDAATRELFGSDEDRLIARDIIEAQMVQPWFAPPPHDASAHALEERVLSEPEVHAQARRVTRALVLGGIGRRHAQSRVRATLLVRDLLAIEGQLIDRAIEGVRSEVVGDLECSALVIRSGPTILARISASPLGRSVELDPTLDDPRRARIAAGLARAHAALLAELRAHRDALDADARLEASLAEIRRTLAAGGPE